MEAAPTHTHTHTQHTHTQGTGPFSRACWLFNLTNWSHWSMPHEHMKLTIYSAAGSEPVLHICLGMARWARTLNLTSGPSGTWPKRSRPPKGSRENSRAHMLRRPARSSAAPTFRRCSASSNWIRKWKAQSKVPNRHVGTV